MGTFTLGIIEFAVYCMAGVGGSEQALGIDLSCLGTHPHEVCEGSSMGSLTQEHCRPIGNWVGWGSR